MRRLLPLLLAGLSAPAFAQHEHHGQEAPAAAEEPHAAHAPAEPAEDDPHAHHAPSPPAPPVAPPPREALSGPQHAADLVYGPAAMAEARAGMREEHGSIKTWKILLDRLEWRARGGRDGWALDGQGWYGGDVDRAWVKAEAEGAFGEAPERVELQALWSRAIDPWFDLQIGLRHDFRPDPERTYLVAGVQGLAPYWFEIDAAAFVSDEGEVSARIEAEYDLRLTQRLILQPAVELDFALQDAPEIGMEAGLSSAELGLRLRYEIEPTFAPYLGVAYERSLGPAGDGGWSFLVGVRTWF